MIHLPTRPTDPRPEAEGIEPTERTFEKGVLPPEVTLANSNAEVYINRFPLGAIEDNFYLSRAALAMNMQRRGPRGDAWSQVAPWEKAYFEALSAIEYKASGDQVSGTDGGFLAPEFWSTRWFDLLRSVSVLDRLPITRIPVPARVLKLPRVTNDVTVAYPGENATITSSDYKFGQVTYNARKAAAYTTFSNELIRDAPGTADDLLRRSTSRAIALDRDLQSFVGQTTGVPVGLAFNPAVPGAVGSTQYRTAGYIPATDTGNGGTPGYVDFIGFKYNVENLNGVTTTTAGQAMCDGIVGNSRVTKTVQAILDTSNRPVWPLNLEADGGFIGVPNWPVAGNTILPINVTKGNQTDTSYLIGGQWREFVLFECLTLAFDTTTEAAAFQLNQTAVRVIHRWDASPIHPEAFAVMSGVRG